LANTTHLGKYEKIAIGKNICIKQGSKIAVLSNGTIGVSLAIAKIKHQKLLHIMIFRLSNL
jgi:1-deoxy-D-xylulose-5-phosphate synthase